MMRSRTIVGAVLLAGLMDAVSNYLAAHYLIGVGPLAIPAGTATFALAMTLYDLLRRRGGVRPTVAAMALGFVASLAYAALFGGGTTAWKLSAAAYALVAEAKRRGKGAHMGRCNSYRRLAAAAYAGCDSADGTFLKFAPDTNGPRMLAWFDRLARQPHLAAGERNGGGDE